MPKQTSPHFHKTDKRRLFIIGPAAATEKARYADTDAYSSVQCHTTNTVFDMVYDTASAVQEAIRDEAALEVVFADPQADYADVREYLEDRIEIHNAAEGAHVVLL